MNLLLCCPFSVSSNSKEKRNNDLIFDLRQHLHFTLHTMGLRDALRKKDAIDHDQGPDIFVRSDSDTITQQFATAPDQQQGHEQAAQGLGQGSGSPGFNDALLSPAASTSGEPRKSRRSFDFFHSSSDRPRSPSASSATSQTKKESTARRLSHRLHLSRAPKTSDHVPQDLPEIVVPGTDAGDREAEELQWEKRATMLAGQNDRARSPADGAAHVSLDGAAARSRSASTHSATAPVSSKQIDADIQEAIRLHEEGNFAEATKMFGRLADENGANNPLSQVLYGLALR